VDFHHVPTRDFPHQSPVCILLVHSILWCFGILRDGCEKCLRHNREAKSSMVSEKRRLWFHNNGAAYNRADNSLIVSSRENFVICLDYNTSAIKWILGDPTKKWHQFPSLRKFALTLAPGSLPPIGQHAPSITFDQNLLVFDNGQKSNFQMPAGDQRAFASPRKYTLDLVGKIATEVWNFPMNESIHCPLCGSVYEDAPLNYLIDYAFVNSGLPGSPTFAQLQGLDALGDTSTAYNSIPIHLENTKFPTVGPQALNLSTRGSFRSVTTF
jgi:arylsulfate sulfotransferase